MLYQPDENTRLEVRLEDDTVWLTKAHMADLFGTQRPAVTKHLSNIFKDGELDQNAVSSILEHTADDGKMPAITLMGIAPDVILSQII